MRPIIFKEPPNLKEIQKDYLRRGGMCVQLYMFPSLWGSSCKGKSGIGLSCLTPSYTVVIWDSARNCASVYYDEEYGYSIKNPNSLFWDDINNNRIKSNSSCGVYLQEGSEIVFLKK